MSRSNKNSLAGQKNRVLLLVGGLLCIGLGIFGIYQRQGSERGAAGSSDENPALTGTSAAPTPAPTGVTTAASEPSPSSQGTTAVKSKDEAPIVRIAIEDEEKAAELRGVLEYYKNKGEPDLRIKDVKPSAVDYADRKAEVPYDTPFARLYIDYGRHDTEFLMQESEWVKEQLQMLRQEKSQRSSEDLLQRLRLAEVRDRAIQKLLDYRNQKMLAYRRLNHIEVE